MDSERIKEGGCKEDVKTSCLTAVQVFYQLSPILGHKYIIMTSNTHIIKAVFAPSLLYQSENWTLTSPERQVLTTTEMRCIRKAAGNTRMDKIRHEEIGRRVNMKPAQSKQEQDQVVVPLQEDGINGSPEQSARHQARRTTTEGKAQKSLGA